MIVERNSQFECSLFQMNNKNLFKFSDTFIENIIKVCGAAAYFRSD